MGNLHLRFDEGRAGRATRVAFSPTLPIGLIGDPCPETVLDEGRLSHGSVY